MSEVSERYGSIANGFTARVLDVAPDQWSVTTPCSEWTVRDLVTHVITTQRRVLAALEGGEALEVDSDEDLRRAWAAASGAVMDAVTDPETASKTVSGMFGEQPFESLVGRMVCADTLVHTWDLARAIGQDEALDPDAVAHCTEFLGPLDEAIRRPGGFAEKIEPPSDADEQTRFLNLCGRAV